MPKLTAEHRAMLSKLFEANVPPGPIGPQVAFNEKEVSLLIEAILAGGTAAIPNEQTRNVLEWITSIPRSSFAAHKAQDDALDAQIETLRSREPA